MDIPTPIKSFVNHLKIESTYFLMLLLFPSLVLFLVVSHNLCIKQVTRHCELQMGQLLLSSCHTVGTKIQSKEGQIKKGMPLTFSEKFECVMK